MSVSTALYKVNTCIYISGFLKSAWTYLSPFKENELVYKPGWYNIHISTVRYTCELAKFYEPSELLML